MIRFGVLLHLVNKNVQYDPQHLLNKTQIERGMQQFKSQVVEFISTYINNPLIEKLLSTPKELSHGDFALPVFPLAKQSGQNPMEFAKELAQKMSADLPNEHVTQVVAVGPYINLFLNKAKVIETVLAQVHDQKDQYGATSQTNPTTYALDYSAPNIAKPFGIGHLRSTVIGNSNKNILQFLGHNVTGINYIGDWGTQFGKVIWAYKAWGNERDLQKDPIPYLLELYVRFHEEAEKSDTMDDEARTIFAELEKGNAEYLKLWSHFRELSITNFQKTYDLMNVSFDEYRGESYYNDKMDLIIAQLRDKKLLKESEGAQIIDFTDFDEKSHLSPIILLKSNGGSTYALRDLAAAVDRVESFNADVLLYEVGAEQKLHFEQVFKALELLGYDWATDCVHLDHGLYRFRDGKMSTRKGNIVLMEDVLADSITRVKKIIEERNETLAKSSQFDDVANQIGVGAVLFYDMKHDRIKDLEFSWDKLLDFQGETGPYVQYTHARIQTILQKANFDLTSYDVSLLTHEKERELVLQLASFTQQLEQAAKQYKPHVLCRYLLDVSQSFNEYYGAQKIIDDDKNATTARLVLISAVAQVIRNGLNLLGIAAPNEM